MSAMHSRGELAADLVEELVDRYEDGRTNAPLIARLRELVEPGAGALVEEVGKRSKGKRMRDPGAERGAMGTPPWWGPAAELLTDIEAGARQIEAQARKALGFTTARRSASTEHAEASLRALPKLLGALDPADLIVGHAITNLRSWHRTARTLTGHRQPWPRVPGHSCPYCQAASLRQRPRDGAVVCVTPGCTTGAGSRPVWTLEELDRLGVVIRTTKTGTNTPDDGEASA